MGSTSVHLSVPCINTARYISYQHLIGTPVWYSIQNLDLYDSLSSDDYIFRSTKMCKIEPIFIQGTNQNCLLMSNN